MSRLQGLAAILPLPLPPTCVFLTPSQAPAQMTLTDVSMHAQFMLEHICLLLQAVCSVGGLLRLLGG